MKKLTRAFFCCQKTSYCFKDVYKIQGAAIMPIVNLIDAGIVQTRLLSSGWDEVAAESLYGQLTGFASPITQFPQVFMTAIVMSLVPMVSDVYKRQI